MTTYYVKTAADGGSDAANGTSAATAWATIGKALGATGIAGTDTVYVAPGTYREAVTVAMTSPTGETFVLGDRDGSHFSGIPGGDVVWTAYTTNDTTAPSTSAALNLNGRDFLTFRNINFVGANDSAGGCVKANTASSTSIKLEDCTFVDFGRLNSLQPCIGVLNAADVALNWTIDRCDFFVNGAAVVVTLNTSASADYDANVLIRNSRILCMGNRAIAITATGAGAFKGGGVRVRDCTIACGAANAVITLSANISTGATTRCFVNDCFVVSSAAALVANVQDQIEETNNRIVSPTPRTLVTAGSGSVSDNSHAVLVEVGQDRVTGRQLRPYLSPLAGSPLLGFGAAASPPTVDVFNRPRPSGGAITNAAGAMERHEYGRKGVSLGGDAGDYLELVGPGDHQFDVPVDAVSTTIAVKVKWDSNHADTNKPQAMLLNGGEIGWPDETKTATGTAGSAYETLTFTARTPSAKGIVTLRLVSRSAAANGIVAFDTVTVT